MKFIEHDFSQHNAEIVRLRAALEEIRLLTRNPEDNGLAVVKVYSAATNGLRGDVGGSREP